MSPILYKAVCARLLQVDFTERINLCCLCLETVGESGACVDDEVVLNLHLGRPFHSVKLANLLKFVLDESFTEVMTLLKSVCKQCLISAIAGYKFIQQSKDNTKKLAKVLENLNESLDELLPEEKINCKSLYVAIQPSYNSTAMIKRYYDIRRQFIPEDTACLRFSQIANKQNQSPESCQDDIYHEIDQTLIDLMCCKTIIDTKELLDNPDKPNEFKCKICKEQYTSSTSLRVHFFQVHRRKQSNCSKCNTTKSAQAKVVRQKQLIVETDQLKVTNTEHSPNTINNVEEDPLETHDEFTQNTEEPEDIEPQFEDSDDQFDEQNHSEHENSVTVVPTELLLQDKFRGKVVPPTSSDIDSKYVVESNTKMDNCCNNCGMKFSTRARYLTHKKKFKDNDCRRHRGRGEFKCNLCNFTAFYKHHVRRHVEFKHLGVKRYICSYCNRNCSSNAELEIHMRKHTGEKPFQCNECGGNFASKNGLKHHKYIHTGEFPYKCEFCNQAFRTGTRRGEHIARIHTSPSLKCKICGQMFKIKQDLNRHEIRHHATKPLIKRRKEI